MWPSSSPDRHHAHDRIRVGISSCLLGESVRFDGGHKHDACVNETLSKIFEFVPVCPEVAIGLGVSREPIHLMRVGDEVRVRGVHTPDLDVTQRLRDYGSEMADRLTDISGYIFKSGSPSCGLRGVHVASEPGRSDSHGRGAYAAALTEGRPLLPSEEEGRLRDATHRDNFIASVLAYHRRQRQVGSRLDP